VFILVFFKQWTMDKVLNLNGYKNNKIEDVRREKYSWRVRLTVATMEHR